MFQVKKLKNTKYYFKYKSQVSLLRCVCDEREEGFLGVEGQAGQEHLVRGEVHHRTGITITITITIAITIAITITIIITLGQRRCTPLHRYYVPPAGIALAITFFTKVAGRVKRQFGDFSLFCPAEPEEYLDRTYGHSWPHTGIISGNFLHSSKANCFFQEKPTFSTTERGV